MITLVLGGLLKGPVINKVIEELGSEIRHITLSDKDSLKVFCQRALASTKMIVKFVQQGNYKTRREETRANDDFSVHFDIKALDEANEGGVVFLKLAPIVELALSLKLHINILAVRSVHGLLLSHWPATWPPLTKYEQQ